MASSSSAPPPLLKDLHIRYIASLATHTGSLAYHLTTHLRVNAIYWAVASLHLLGAPQAIAPAELSQFVLNCWDEEQGAFGSYKGHDAHILGTLSAIQVLVMNDDMQLLDEGKRERLTKYILSLQDAETGAFSGDSTHLEQDTRFLYCAVSSLCLLGTLTQLNLELTKSAIMACYNHDGGFGTVPGSESHAGQVFVCVGALAILEALDELGDKGRERTGTWLAERQLPGGGLNGRPQKLEDVCYSWWVLSALSILGKLHWISGSKLSSFILSAQDPDNGGIADRPDNVADVFHTFFGVAGLSMLNGPQAEGLQEVDPVFALPAGITQKLGIRRDYQRLEPWGREKQ